MGKPCLYMDSFPTEYSYEACPAIASTLRALGERRAFRYFGVETTINAMTKILSLTLVLTVLIGCNPKPETSATDAESSAATATTAVSPAYFKATGNEPFWSVEIGESGIVFTSMIEGLETVNTPHAEPTRAADANVKIYNIRTEATDLDIQILQQDCRDSMADTAFAYTVSVRIKRTADTESRELQGCGRYLTDPALAGRWTLTDLLGLPVMQED